MSLPEQPRVITLPPPPRRKSLSRRVFEESFNDDVFGQSAQMAYYFLLSVFPFLLLLAALLPYVTHPQAVERLMALIEPFIPPQALEFVWGNLQTLLTHKSRSLISLSAIALLWAASSGFAAIIGGLNIAYKVPPAQGRPFWKSRFLALAFTVGLGLMLVVSVVLLVFGKAFREIVAEYLDIPMFLWIALRWTIALVFLLLTLDILYYVAPKVKHRWRWLSPGALLAIPAWLGASKGFSLYVSHLGRYEATYGALATVILLMLWFYLSSLVLLIGGELNSHLEQQPPATDSADERD
jgi:membrane protein